MKPDHVGNEQLQVPVNLGNADENICHQITLSYS